MPPLICTKFDYQHALKIVACEKLCLSCWMGPIKTWLSRTDHKEFNVICKDCKCEELSIEEMTRVFEAKPAQQ
eukprot:s4420_g5.t1